MIVPSPPCGSRILVVAMLSLCMMMMVVSGQLAISPLPEDVPDGVVGVPFSVSFAGSGGSAPYSIIVSSGSLPTGLGTSDSLQVSGTPTQAETATFDLEVTDRNGVTFSNTYTIRVVPNIIMTPETGALPDGELTIPYTATFACSGGTGPYWYTISQEPSGLSLSDGTLSGTPTVNDLYSFTVTCTDSSAGGSNSLTKSYTLQIYPYFIYLNPVSDVASATIGVEYSQTITASRGTGPYVFEIRTGALPVGVEFDTTTGVFSGTPTEGGQFSFSLEVTDSTPAQDGGPFTGSSSYNMAVNAPTITMTPSSPLPNGEINVEYNAFFTCSGGTPPYSYQLVTPYFSINEMTGLVSGSISKAGTYTIYVSCIDSSTGSGPFFVNMRPYSLTINGPTITLAPGTLIAGTAGAVYSQTLVASGGEAPYSFTIVSGWLPGGLSLSEGGVLGGTLTQTGQFSFTIRATDASSFNETGGPFFTQVAYTMLVAAPTITLTPSSIPDGVLNEFYSVNFTCTGGSGDYTYQIFDGSYPDRIVFNSATGEFSGILIDEGSFGFKIRCTDSTTGDGPYSATLAYSFDVAAPTITLTPISIPDGFLNEFYSVNFTCTGGSGDYTYLIFDGSYPDRIVFNSATGEFSGILVDEGSFTFKIKCTDSTIGDGNYFATITYSFDVTVKEVTSTGPVDVTTTSSTSDVVSASTTIATTTSDNSVTSSVTSSNAVTSASATSSSSAAASTSSGASASTSSSSVATVTGPSTTTTATTSTSASTATTQAPSTTSMTTTTGAGSTSAATMSAATTTIALTSTTTSTTTTGDLNTNTTCTSGIQAGDIIAQQTYVLSTASVTSSFFVRRNSVRFSVGSIQMNQTVTTSSTTVNISPRNETVSGAATLIGSAYINPTVIGSLSITSSNPINFSFATCLNLADGLVLLPVIISPSNTNTILSTTSPMRGTSVFGGSAATGRSSLVFIVAQPAPVVSSAPASMLKGMMTPAVIVVAAAAFVVSF